jgi:low affinity Fe/Cu permease
VHRSGGFNRFAKVTATVTGHPFTFIAALLIVVVWGISGPLFHFSDTWQLVINTGTTIVTFLMVFLIQNTQNRDSAALHIKLDELIRISQGAHNALLNLEDLTDEEIHQVQERYRTLAEHAHAAQDRGHRDTSCPAIDLADNNSPTPAPPAG